MADDATAPKSPEDIALARVFPNGLPAAGRPGGMGNSYIVRSFPLEARHLELMAEQRESGMPLNVPNGIQQGLASIKRRHHRLAMLLATGQYTDGQCAALCGLNPASVSVMKQDPAFAELLAMYGEGVTAEFRDTVAEMRELADDVVAAIRDKLDNHSETLTVPQLNELLKTLTDRTGNGPASTVNSRAVIAHVDASTLARIRAGADAGGGVQRQPAALSADNMRTIEGTFRPVADGAAEGTEGVGAGPGPSLRAEGVVVDIRDLFGDADAGASDDTDPSVD